MERNNLTFRKENYIIILIGLVLIVAGYVLIAGGGSDDPNVFSEAIFDTRRLTIAPIMILLGFGFEIAGILYRAKDTRA